MHVSKSQIATLSLLVTLASCGSQVRVSDFPAGTTPQEAIESAQSSQDKAYQVQADALAYDEFKEGKEELADAEEDYNEQDDREDILESAAEAKAYFDESIRLAGERKANAAEILASRQATTDAGILKYRDLMDKRAALDEDLRDSTYDFTTALSNESFTELQKKYLDLEVQTTQRRELISVRNTIDMAIEKNAEDRAPNTLKMAQKHLIASENLIATNVRQPNTYAASVAEAQKSALLLEEVMKKFDKLGENVSEQAALELVYQDRKISNQNERIGDLRGDVKQYATGMTLLGQEALSAQSKIEFQKALERVGKELPKSDAEVYQQGNKLIIRLKKMNFHTGSAEIPEESTTLLDNIGEIIGDLNAESILVQGHTDSRGGDELNQNLSEKRAKAVEQYLAKNVVDKSLLEAKGYGESSPLASNDSAQGRSQNRRVDIVITAKPE